MDVKEMLNQSKLDWTVRMEKLQTISGIELPEHFGIIRNDTNKVLSVRGEGYSPYQNDELMELLFKVSKSTGLELHRGGLFDGGAKVFIQLKSGDLTLGDDKIEGQITGLNSFDGSTSLCFGNSTITISCRNTFFGAMKQIDTRVRHTKNMTLKIDEICRRLEVALVEENEMFKDIVKLSETSLDKAIEEKVIRSLFKIDKDVALTDEKQISTRTRNQISQFQIDRAIEVQGKGENLWGIMSSVTRYTSNSIGKSRKDYDPDSKMFSQVGQREREVYNYLTSLV